MNSKVVKTVLPMVMGILFLSCADINSSWEIDGGGYLKYKVNDEGPFTIDLSKKDVEPPFRQNNNHAYFYLETRLEESKRGDAFAIMVNRPSTDGKITPVDKANIITGNGDSKYQSVTWMTQNNTNAPLANDSVHKSYIHFDEIISDSLYTADVDLYFQDCRRGSCNENPPFIHVTGRLRYWLPHDERD